MDYTNNLYSGASRNIIAQARELRKKMTPEEEIFWKCLTKKNTGYKFRRQHPVANFIVDFYCHEKKLAIEIDGGIHNIPENKAKDKGRTEELKKYGIRDVRYTNDDIIERVEAVVSDIIIILEQ